MSGLKLEERLADMSDTLSTGIISYFDLGVGQLAQSYAAKTLEACMPIIWLLFVVDDRILEATPEYAFYRECKKMLWYKDLVQESEIMRWSLSNEASMAMGIYAKMCRSEDVTQAELDFLLKFLFCVDEAIFDYVQKSVAIEMEHREFLEELAKKPVYEVMTESGPGLWRRFTISSNQPPYRPLSAEKTVKRKHKVGVTGLVIKKLLDERPEVFSTMITPRYIQVRLYREADWISFLPQLLEIFKAALHCDSFQLKVRPRHP